MDLSIVIVSYNTAAFTMACLESVEKAAGEKDVWIVDNASTDDSVERIRTRFPGVHLIANQANLGFAAANNMALARCRGRYAVFLNPDTVVKPDAFQTAAAFMDKNPEIGLAGAKILNPDGTLQESVSYRYPGEKYTSGETARLPGKIACVLGAFMIARKSLLDELGGFDEDFFLYGEDQDLAWRIREKGLSIGYIEDANVFHWGGQSEARTPQASVFEKKLRAEYLFYSKHYTTQTIGKIRRAERVKARYRLITLKLTSIITGDRDAHRNKTLCYRIALDMASR